MTNIEELKNIETELTEKAASYAQRIESLEAQRTAALEELSSARTAVDSADPASDNWTALAASLSGAENKVKVIEARLKAEKDAHAYPDDYFTDVLDRMAAIIRTADKAAVKTIANSLTKALKAAEAVSDLDAAANDIYAAARPNAAVTPGSYGWTYPISSFCTDYNFRHTARNMRLLLETCNNYLAE